MLLLAASLLPYLLSSSPATARSGWGDDENCFSEWRDPHKIIVGSRRYSPVVGAYNHTNVSVVGSGTIDGRGEIWWQNCTACHYPPHNNSALCEIASRPKLLEFQFVSGLTGVLLVPLLSPGCVSHADGAVLQCTARASPRPCI